MQIRIHPKPRQALHEQGHDKIRDQTKHGLQKIQPKIKLYPQRFKQPREQPITIGVTNANPNLQSALRLNNHRRLRLNPIELKSERINI